MRHTDIMGKYVKATAIRFSLLQFSYFAKYDFCEPVPYLLSYFNKKEEKKKGRKNLKERLIFYIWNVIIPL